jgi:hypothetical protein
MKDNAESTSPRSKSATPSVSSLTLGGMTAVEVDTGGIFIQLTVSVEGTDMPQSLCLDDAEHTESISSRFFKQSASFMSMSSHNSSSLSRKDKKLPSNGERMTLHIPASEHITVCCTQPASLEIIVPMQRAPAPYSSGSGRDRSASSSSTSSDTGFPVSLQVLNSYSDTGSPRKNNEDNRSNTSNSVNSSPDSSPEQKQQSLQQVYGIPIAPWSYIQNHNQRALDVTDDDELEESNFALTFASLERYIGSLPHTATHIKITVALGDRIQRDALALSIRVLAGQCTATTIDDRRKALPWSELPLKTVPKSHPINLSVYEGSENNDENDNRNSEIASPVIESFFNSALDGSADEHINTAISIESTPQNIASKIAVLKDELGLGLGLGLGVVMKKETKLQDELAIALKKENVLKEKMTVAMKKETRLEEELVIASKRETNLVNDLTIASKKETKLEDELATAAETVIKLTNELADAVRKETKLQNELIIATKKEVLHLFISPHNSPYLFPSSYLPISPFSQS